MSKYTTQDIIRFLDGEMDEQEFQLFKAELENNESLQKDVTLYKNVSSTLKYSLAPDESDKAFRANIKDLNKKYFTLPKAKNTTIFTMQKYWFAAAALVVALLIWAPWNKNLYDNYSKIEMVSVAERGDDNQQILIEATDKFNKEEFAEAKLLLEKLLTENPEDHMLRFYYGVALLETNEIRAAKENFEVVFAGESIFKYDAAFYNALAYLKDNNKEKAKEWLLKIDKDADVYEKAEELLSEIN